MLCKRKRVTSVEERSVKYTMTSHELQTAIDSAIEFLKDNDNENIKRSLEDMIRAQAIRATHVLIKD